MLANTLFNGVVVEVVTSQPLATHGAMHGLLVLGTVLESSRTDRRTLSVDTDVATATQIGLLDATVGVGTLRSTIYVIPVAVRPTGGAVLEVQTM